MEPSPPPDATPEIRLPPVRPVDLRDYVRFVDGEATRVRVLAADRLALDLWCLQPQTATSPLHLPAEDVTYTVLAGRSWFVTDDGEVGLDPLGAMLVPAGVVHGIANRAADPLIVMATCAPPSADPEQEPVQRTDAAVHRDDGSPGLVRRSLDRLLGGSRPATGD